MTIRVTLLGIHNAQYTHNNIERDEYKDTYRAEQYYSMYNAGNNSVARGMLCTMLWSNAHIVL